MNEQNIKREISSFLQNDGVSILGVAAVKQLPSIPENFSPQTLLEGARSIICYGVPIPKGIVYAKSNNLTLYWRLVIHSSEPWIRCPTSFVPF